jgi:hypothetical protein
VAAHEAEITTVHKTFQDYRVRHHKKLCEFWVNLEKEVNENGVRCLPYPGKNSTIGKVVEWFDKEIQVLSVVIARAKKNSYATALQESLECCTKMQTAAILRCWRLS